MCDFSDPIIGNINCGDHVLCGVWQYAVQCEKEMTMIFDTNCSEFVAGRT